MKSIRQILLAGIMISIISIGVVGSVYAQDEGSGTILACYKKNNGQLRIVSGISQCNPSEIFVSLFSKGNDNSGEKIGSLTGRWDGTLTFSSAQCPAIEAQSFTLLMVQLASGDITGSVKTSRAGSVSTTLFGNSDGYNIEFDSGSGALNFSGTLNGTDDMSGTFVSSGGYSCPQGTWSVHRLGISQ